PAGEEGKQEATRLLGGFAKGFALGLRFTFDAEPGAWREARRALVHQPDLDKAADAGFPFGSRAYDFFDVTAFGFFEHSRDDADETPFAAGKVGPPLLSFFMCCFHGCNNTRGGGTKMGPYFILFAGSYSQF